MRVPRQSGSPNRSWDRAVSCAAVEVAVGFVDDQRHAARLGPGRRSARISEAGYSTPPGLLGVTRTMARVRGVMSRAAASGSGNRSGSGWQRHRLAALPYPATFYG